MTAVKFFVLACFSVLSAAVYADDVPVLYHGADLKLGEQLIAEHQCTACHQRKFGGDGNAIYRPAGKVNSLSALRGMVESCNQQLDFRLFPEEVTSISAVLNRDHYRFK
jgi:cytochrome c2